MKIFFVACFFLGSLVVFQPSLNRLLSAEKGLGFAVCLNATVLFALASLLFAVNYFAPQKLIEPLRFTASDVFHWWHVVPGMMGFVLVITVPVLIKNFGSFPTVVTMIAGQVTTSFLWDMYHEGVRVSGARLFGIILVVTGVYFSFKP